MIDTVVALGWQHHCCWFSTAGNGCPSLNRGPNTCCKIAGPTSTIILFHAVIDTPMSICKSRIHSHHALSATQKARRVKKRHLLHNGSLQKFDYAGHEPTISNISISNFEYLRYFGLQLSNLLACSGHHRKKRKLICGTHCESMQPSIPVRCLLLTKTMNTTALCEV